MVITVGSFIIICRVIILKRIYVRVHSLEMWHFYTGLNLFLHNGDINAH